LSLELFSITEKIPSDEFRDNRGYGELEIPLLTEDVGMDGTYTDLGPEVSLARGQS
jgi:hypothetical protein